MDGYAILIGLAGCAVGGASVWVWNTLRASSRSRTMEGEVTRLATRLEERTGRLTELEAEAEQIPELLAARARLEAELAAERRVAQERSQTLGAGEEALRSVAEDTLRRMDHTLEAVERERAVSTAALAQQLQAVADSHRQLQTETGALARVLAAPTGRGRWGEMQLRRVVEMAGMQEHCDFDVQVTTDGEEGLLRPDMVVHLPGGRHIVVDAKVPLPKGTEGEAEAKRHARQVRDHMARLGAKRYWSQFPATPEFVVMFLPGESLFALALQADSTLLDHGVQQRVLPASPTTLIALLRATAHGWQRDHLAANVEEIGAAGRDLYQRLMALTDHLAGVGKGLGKAVAEYNRTAELLDTGVLPAADRLQDLGAASTGQSRTAGAITTQPSFPRELEGRTGR
jgi:DNA recombination protein RmuC